MPGVSAEVSIIPLKSLAVTSVITVNDPVISISFVVAKNEPV